MTPEELAATEAPTVQIPIHAGRPAWWQRATLAVLAALAVTSGGGLGLWAAVETAARR